MAAIDSDRGEVHDRLHRSSDRVRRGLGLADVGVGHRSGRSPGALIDVQMIVDGDGDGLTNLGYMVEVIVDAEV